MIPTFTVIITTRNRMAYLPRAIESAEKQNLPCEIVVIDDDSSDGTEAYCRKLGSRIIYQRNQPNIGQSASINEGVRLASGEWIKHLDDDDFLMPDCLEKLAKVISLRPQAAICACKMVEVDENGKVLPGRVRDETNRAYVIPQEDLHFAMLYELAPFGPTSQVAVKKEAYVKGGGWNPNYYVFNDSDAWTKAARFGDAIFLDARPVYHMIWPDSITVRTSVERHLLNLLEVKQLIYGNIAAKHRHRTPSLKSVLNYLYLHWSLSAFKRKQPWTALRLLARGGFSGGAWKMLGDVRRLHRNGDRHPDVQRIELPL